MGERMGFEMREALRRLCVEIGWSYAVFWRAIGSPTPKHLAWEDGHWYGKLQLLENNDVNSQFNSLTEIGSQGVCSVDELVNKTMVPKIHDIGDGIVGLAASTGNHHWILRYPASNNTSFLTHLADMGNQFLAGIQTIVVIPVLPHGVVQFGSTKRVMENILFVKHVRTSFMQLACVPGPYFGFTQNSFGQEKHLCESISPAICDYPFQDDYTNVDRSLSLRCNHQLFVSPASSMLKQASSSLSPRCQENLPKIDADQCRSIIHSLGNSHFHLDNRMESGLLEAQVLSNGDAVSSPNGVSGVFDTYSLLPKFETMESAHALERLASTSNCTKENNQISNRNVSGANPLSIVQDIDTLNGSKGISVSSHVNNSSSNKSQEILSFGNPKENNLPRSYGVSSSSCNGLTFCPCQKCRLGGSSTISLIGGIESADLHGNHGCKVDKLQRRALEIDPSIRYVPNENSPSFLPLATSGDDLFDIFGLYEGVHKGVASCQQLAADEVVCNAQLHLPPIFCSDKSDLSCTEVFSDSNTDQLLDAVVSKINIGSRQSLDDNISCKTSLTKVSGSSIYCGSPSSDVSASTAKEHGDYISPSLLSSKVEASGSTTVRSAESMDETRRPESYKSQISLWVESGQNMRSESLFASHGKRVDDLNKVHRKRQRPGENPRPRPKDRQLIMDRVKELREIVPNGSKCSIDALLEKTIKHMLFLQSVTKHADKLGETGEPKIISEDGRVLMKDNFQGGATWAFEVGSEPITCPIIVEDLNPPREMLVEMLCEEHGFFLEIADLIRGLGLTILKGVMEARKDKIWARFAVEANRDVTRMEIFLSLVRLLEPTFGSGATPHFMHNNNMPHKIFSPSVPAIGMSDPLQ